MGVARVNGDLAVSRAFGDAQHKTTGGPSPEDHPVSAAPELKDCFSYLPKGSYPLRIHFNKVSSFVSI